MTDLHFSQVCILGYGLIGASLAKAIKARGLAARIVAFDHDKLSLRAGMDEGLLQAEALTVKQARALVEGSDLVLFALPPRALLEVAQQLAPYIGQQALVMDVASVKGAILDGMQKILPHPKRYIPAHPIAGSASAGQGGSHADLYVGRQVILTPPVGIEITDPALVDAREFWTQIGASVLLMPADVHDVIYAHVSHLPQAVAFAAGAAITKRLSPSVFVHDEIMQRFLRLTSSPAELWSEIYALNAPAVAQAIETYAAFARHFIKELGEGAQHEATDGPPPLAEEVAQLFARITASCLVMTVLQLERQSKMKIAAFAGPGFADMAAPSIESPEQDYARISAAWKPLLAMIEESCTTLEGMAAQLRLGQGALLLDTLRTLRAA